MTRRYIMALSRLELFLLMKSSLTRLLFTLQLPQPRQLCDEGGLHGIIA